MCVLQNCVTFLWLWLRPPGALSAWCPLFYPLCLFYPLSAALYKIHNCPQRKIITKKKKRVMLFNWVSKHVKVNSWKKMSSPPTVKLLCLPQFLLQTQRSLAGSLWRGRFWVAWSLSVEIWGVCLVTSSQTFRLFLCGRLDASSSVPIHIKKRQRKSNDRATVWT